MGDRFEMDGEVVEVLKGGKFKVKLFDTDSIVECTTSGKLKQNFINIISGDKVTIDISPYDVGKGRIIWRNK